MKNKKLISLLPFLLLFLVFLFCFAELFFGFYYHSQSFYFQDETDHLVMGWMMTDYGKQLYTDLTINHQPVPVFLGAILIKVLPHDSLYRLVEGLRISMFAFQFLMALILMIRFRWKGLGAAIAYNSLAYFYFAWYVLAEAIAAPLIAYIVLEILDSFDKQQIENWKIVICHLTLVVLFFTLLPLWPFILLSQIYFWFKQSNKQKIFSLTFLTIVIGYWLLVIGFNAWLRETVVNNVFYFLPYQSDTNYLKAFLLPITSFLSLQSTTSRFFAFGISVFAYALIKNFGQLKRTKNILLICFTTLLLLSLNLRVTDSTMIFYQGFHLFPYLAAFSSLVAWVLANTLAPLRSQTFRTSRGTAVLAVSAVVFFNNSLWVFEKKDKLSEYVINYGDFATYAQMIKDNKNEDSTLLSGPNGAGFLNIMSETPIAGRQLFHLDWAYRSPFLLQEFRNMMTNNPPDFIYYPSTVGNFYHEIKNTLTLDYQELIGADGNHTHVFERIRIN